MNGFESNEYYELLINKYEIDGIINFLERSNEISSYYISPIIKSLIDLKDILLPAFKKISEELQEKIDNVRQRNRIYSK